MSLRRAEIIGAWSLVSVVSVYEDGQRVDELGPRPAGYLCYTPEGFVSATLGDSTRPTSRAGDPHSATADEYAAMTRKFIAYAGRYSLDEATSTVVHRMEVSLFTNWTGQGQERHLAVDGDTLTITASPRVAADGRSFHSELVWRRDGGATSPEGVPAATKLTGGG